jgi:hypothetical protein
MEEQTLVADSSNHPRDLNRCIYYYPCSIIIVAIYILAFLVFKL